MKSKKVNDVYQMSAGLQLLALEKNGTTYNDNESLFESIRTLLSEGREGEKRDILGLDPYIDYKLFSKEFTYSDIEKNLEVFDEAMPERKKGRLTEKVKLLEKMVIDYYVDLEVAFVAARLRRKYFNDKDEVDHMMSFYRNELM